MKRYDKVTEAIYEAARLEAIWSKRPVIPEPWDQRDQKFKEAMIAVVKQYLTERFPTPEEAHQSWMETYLAMGWKYGPVRDPVAKTHPDLVPYADLPKDEKDKDAVFLAMIYAIRKTIEAVETEMRDELAGLQEKLREAEFSISIFKEITANWAASRE